MALLIWLMCFGCNGKSIQHEKPTAHTLNASDLAAINAKAISLPVWERLDSLRRALDELKATTVANASKTRHSAKNDTTIMSNELPFYHGMYDTIIIHQ